MPCEKKRTPPLLSWDIAQQGYWNLLEHGRRQQDHLVLEQFAQRYGWTSNARELLDAPYQALVLTDSRQIISWVNPGFKEMTGYPGQYALGKSPKFLQGNRTDPRTRQEIRERLSLQKPYAGTIVNYRKNGEAYKCVVKIIPLFNEQDALSHYLALEREVA